MRTLALALALLVPMAAQAHDNPEHYRRGQQWARIGAGTAGAGVALSFGGLIVLFGEAITGGERSPQYYAGFTMMGLGAVAFLTSPALMAGGVNRASGALASEGADVDRMAGYAAWGLWGGALAMAAIGANLKDPDAVGTMQLGAGLLFLGSFAANVLQMHTNGVAKGRTWEVSLAPVGGREWVGAGVRLRF